MAAAKCGRLTRMAYASVWRRLEACTVDAALVAGLTVSAVQSWGGSTTRDLLVGAGCVLVCELAMAFQESRRGGATFGKRVLGIRVTDEDAARLRFTRSVVRNAAKWAPVNLLGASVLAGWFLPAADAAMLRPPLHIAAYGLTAMGFFALWLGPHWQALHDSLAGSIVIVRRPPPGMNELDEQGMRDLRILMGREEGP